MREKLLHGKNKATVAVCSVLLVALAALMTLEPLLRPAPVHAMPPTGPTSIASQTPKGPYPGTVGAGALALTFTAADTVNGNSFPMTGHEVLIIWNSDASPHTITLTSVVDNRGRTNDVTAYSVAATSYASFNFRSGTEGWLQTSDNSVHFSASDATVKFAVIYVP